MRKYSISKNKLHNHIRNKECQQSFIKSKSVNKINRTLFFISETEFNDVITVIITARMKYFTHITIIFIFAIKSSTSHDNYLSSLFISEKNIINDANIVITSLTYEIITLKTYFKIVDLYMRYASLNIRNRKY